MMWAPMLVLVIRSLVLSIASAIRARGAGDSGGGGGRGGYNINPGTDRLNWWFSGLGVTRELNPKWTIGAEIYYTTATAQGQRNSTGFNVGAIYNINDIHHLMISVGRNLINASQNNEFSTFIGYQLTF